MRHATYGLVNNRLAPEERDRVLSKRSLFSSPAASAAIYLQLLNSVDRMMLTSTQASLDTGSINRQANCQARPVEVTLETSTTAGASHMPASDPQLRGWVIAQITFFLSGTYILLNQRVPPPRPLVRLPPLLTTTTSTSTSTSTPEYIHHLLIDCDPHIVHPHTPWIAAGKRHTGAPTTQPVTSQVYRSTPACRCGVGYLFI